jgi:hypothetical protein
MTAGIRFKLLLGFGAVVALAAMIGVVSLWSLDRVDVLGASMLPIAPSRSTRSRKRAPHWATSTA